MTTGSRVPELQAGDRLSRDEFERRYDAMPHVKKAELLEGVVYMPSPVRIDHGRPHALLAAWLGDYAIATPGVSSLLCTSYRVDLDNEVQPDLVLRRSDAMARSWGDADGFLAGTPELVVEVAFSSVSYDLHQKLHVYRRAGVGEYVVHRVRDGEVDWFVLRAGHYVRVAVAADGTLRGEAFPGLWLDAAALQRGDAAALRAALERGLATPEHAAFAQRDQKG